MNLKIELTVNDYPYYFDYYKRLNDYYNKYVKMHSYRDNTKILKEIKFLEEILKLKINSYTWKNQQ